MSEEEAKKLVRDAIAAGIFNDLGSGSNVDLCVIRNDYSTEYLRGYEYANLKGEREVNTLPMHAQMGDFNIVFCFSLNTISKKERLQF